MEILVGVACNMEDNTIPEVFGGTDKECFIRFEVDAEDGTIYERSTVRTSADLFTGHVTETRIKAFVYNTMPAEFEEALKKMDVKLYPNTTGRVLDAAKKPVLG